MVEQIDVSTLNALIQGVATAVPSIVVLLIVVSKWKAEICKQISELKTEVEVHIGIAERDKQDFDRYRDKLNDIVSKNALKT